MLIQLEKHEYEQMRSDMFAKRRSWLTGLNGTLYPFKSKRDWQAGLLVLREAYTKPCKALADNVQFLHA